MDTIKFDHSLLSLFSFITPSVHITTAQNVESCFIYAVQIYFNFGMLSVVCPKRHVCLNMYVYFS